MPRGNDKKDKVYAYTIYKTKDHLTHEQEKDKKKKWEPPVPTRVGKKKKRGPDTTAKLPQGNVFDKYSKIFL